MNTDLPATHPSVDYYDSDYPGIATTSHRENLDDMLETRGLAHDIERYLELARVSSGSVLELCCGTGRVAIPLARTGFDVTGVDISAAMLERLRTRLAAEPEVVRSRIRLVQQDILGLDLGDARYALALIPFNSLMLLTGRREQQRALVQAALHLAPGGRLVVDVVNPLALPLKGDPVPVPFLSRFHEGRGRTYTRFAALGPLGADQRQKLFGWYDEIDESGIVRRTPYSMWWWPIFPAELELMLEAAGLEIESVEGGHRREAFTPRAPKIVIIARNLS